MELNGDTGGSVTRSGANNSGAHGDGDGVVVVDRGQDDAVVEVELECWSVEYPVVVYDGDGAFYDGLPIGGAVYVGVEHCWEDEVVVGMGDEVLNDAEDGETIAPEL